MLKNGDLVKLKPDGDDLDIGKLKAVPVDLKRLIDLVDKNVIQKLKYNTDKQDLDEKIEDVENKIRDVIGLDNSTAFNTKTKEVENKIIDVYRLATNTAFDTKIGEA